MRAALALPPTFDCVAEGQDAYVNTGLLKQLAKKHGRFWMFHSQPTTVALPGDRFAKSLKPFTEHQTEPQLAELLREYSDFGVPRPNSYADVFHEHFNAPRVHWSVNCELWDVFAGGWQAGLIGHHFGTYYRYDMRSAYLWAATLGLPDTRTYVSSLKPWREKASHGGVYRVQLLGADSVAPFPFNRARQCLATVEEIETYGLKIGQVIDGVTWTRQTSGERVIEAIKKTSTWKLAARTYWGRWAQTGRVECVSKKSRWELPNFTLNIPWAHTIVSRVKMRLWKQSADAVHVFVDSVITPRRIETGNEIGDWRLENTYPNGVLVRGAGQYGDPTSGVMERMAGVTYGSPLRSFDINARNIYTPALSVE